MKEIFSGVFSEKGRIYTENLVKGEHVYGEALVADGDREFRAWHPERSKLGAAIKNGLKAMPINNGSKILYLGASTGTTVSHVSDIVGKSGIVYAVEFAERVIRKLLTLAEKRKNIVPLLCDARKPEEYAWVEECDVIFCDIADPQQTEIAIRNAREFLKKGGYLMLSVKSQSIDVTKKPQEVYESEKNKLLKSGFSVIETIVLEPFEHDHALIVAIKQD